MSFKVADNTTIIAIIMSEENKQQQKDNTVLPIVVGSISSMNEVMKEFLSGIDEELEKDPHNKKLQGAKWAYSIAISQFYNRFNRYCR